MTNFSFLRFFFCYQRQLVTERRRSSIFSYNSQMRVTPYQRNAFVCILCLFEIITDRGIGTGELYCKLLCGNDTQPIRGANYVFNFLRKIIRTIYGIRFFRQFPRVLVSIRWIFRSEVFMDEITFSNKKEIESPWMENERLCKS